MRRKDRERDRSFAWEVLKKAPYATLSLTDSQGRPYAVPVNIVREENRVYFHSAMAGKKADCMRKNSQVCVVCVENGAEIDWVRQLHPDCRQYWETYKKYGLWNDRTVMAHCVWSDERERQAMKDAGVTVVHCADSNQNICSGVAPVRRMLDEGVKVALGSDIAGGDHLDLLDRKSVV